MRLPFAHCRPGHLHTTRALAISRRIENNTENKLSPGSNATGAQRLP
jgi:hypothetical protein